MKSEAMDEIIDEAVIQRRGAEHGLSSRIQLADALRSLLEALACSAADEAIIKTVAAKIRDASGRLAKERLRPGYIRSVEGALTGFGELSELGPFTGRLHPIAPPFKLVLSGGRAEAFATYGSAYQGAPGFVQGGFIAATFDELLGAVQRGTVRLTVELQISYRAPAPLHRELRYTTWVDELAGRKAYVMGTLHDGERLCAEARGVFVQPRQALF